MKYAVYTKWNGQTGRAKSSSINDERLYRYTRASFHRKLYGKLMMTIIKY